MGDMRNSTHNIATSVGALVLEGRKRSGTLLRDWRFMAEKVVDLWEGPSLPPWLFAFFG